MNIYKEREKAFQKEFFLNNDDDAAGNFNFQRMWLKGFKAAQDILAPEGRSDYEDAIQKALIQAGSLQKFLWGQDDWSLHPFKERNWLAILQKRLDKIAMVDLSNQSWRVEVRKRLLQLAALSIKGLVRLKQEEDNDTR